ncbi:helix-turn-helix transcriptional regulator [Streptomyces sp. HSW2009]|uniref:helix-turn-helix transcriptional regulator n=1 Tax=Streptomyces sp. HSW2009 TaxID=3142890 RepID=UPI0032EAB257
MTSVIGANIKRLREERGWTQTRLGREACRVAGMAGAPVGPQEISRYEKGRRTPREWLPFLAEALGVSVRTLKEPHTPMEATIRGLADGDAVCGDGFAPTIRSISSRLIALDNAMLGLPIADAAVRSFKVVHHRLGKGDYAADQQRDIQAAAAELAEIAGWALFNEGKFGASRRFSQEALYLAGLSGDRSIELLTLQNLGMLAGWTGRPREELAIARTVLDRGRLTPRVEAMFRAREAQGLSGTGSGTEAAESFARARALLQESTARDEPHWAWWVSAREIDRQQGRALHEAEAWHEAIPPLERAMQDEPDAHVGYQNVAAVRLLDSLIAVRSWRTAESEAEKLIPALGEMSSIATLNILDRAANRGRAMTDAPSGLRDALDHISKRISEDPYEI